MKNIFENLKFENPFKKKFVPLTPEQKAQLSPEELAKAEAREAKEAEKAKKEALAKVEKINQKHKEIERDRIYAETIRKGREEAAQEHVAPEGVYVSLQHINKIYPNHVQAVYDFNLDIKKNEFIVFVGPSGCGKSTTLRMIAGLEDITSGSLYIDGDYANDLPPKDRNIAMVFQNYALYPHMNIYENMAFGLRVKKVDPAEIDKRVREAAEILQITDYLDRKPKALSGGQQQRVALGRAIVRHAKVFLMDEPLSNLDAQLRVRMRSEIVRIHNQIHGTTIYVTHDQTEAMTMATRIVVMKLGHVQQIGTPKEIYNHPANTFVATFIGSPSMNLIEANYENGDIVFDDGSRLTLPEEFRRAHDEFYTKSEAEVTAYVDNYKKNLEEQERQNTANDFTQEALDKALAESKLNEQILSRIEKYTKGKGTNEGVDYSAILEQARAEVDSLTEPTLEKVNNLLFKYRLEISFTFDQHVMSGLINNVKRKDFYDSIRGKSSHRIIFGIRPEDIFMEGAAPADATLSPVQNLSVILPELVGNEYYVHSKFLDKDLIAKVPAGNQIQIGDNIALRFNLAKAHLFDTISTLLIK